MSGFTIQEESKLNVRNKTKQSNLKHKITFAGVILGPHQYLLNFMFSCIFCILAGTELRKLKSVGQDNKKASCLKKQPVTIHTKI